MNTLMLNQYHVLDSFLDLANLQCDLMICERPLDVIQASDHTRIRIIETVT